MKIVEVLSFCSWPGQYIVHNVGETISSSNALHSANLHLAMIFLLAHSENQGELVFLKDIAPLDWLSWFWLLLESPGIVF